MKDNTSLPRLLSTKQFAAMAGFGESTVEKLRIFGGGPPFIKLGKGRTGRVVYDLADIEKWLADRKRTNTSQRTPEAA